jgi:hypothetical protein
MQNVSASGLLPPGDADKSLARRKESKHGIRKSGNSGP